MQHMALEHEQEPHRCRLAIIYSQVIPQRLVYTAGTTQHARCGPTHHDMILAYPAAVEHCIKGGHLLARSSVRDGQRLQFHALSRAADFGAWPL